MRNADAGARPVSLGPYRGRHYAHALRWLTHERGGEDVRAVGLVVRDAAWRTLAPSRTRAVQRADRFVVTGRTPVGAGSLRWRVEWRGRPDGFVVEAALVAEGDVETNRCGLVLLLPTARYAGARMRVRHASGGSSERSLPEAIAAHQPARDVAALVLSPRGGGEVDIAVEGDVFEIEDQRNWLDPSFKLYSRPLDAPVPYVLHDGSRVVQRIRVTRRGVALAPADPPVRRGAMPRLGLALAPGGARLGDATRAALRDARPAFLAQRVGSPQDAIDAARLARAIGAALRLEFVGAEASLVEATTRALGHELDRVEAVASHRAGPSASERVVAAFPGARIQSGTFGDFVHLNRDGVAPGAARAVFALCPTVHASDDRSLVETLDALPDVLSHARTIAAPRALDVGPCSLRRRLMPRTGAPDVPDASGRARDEDPRQPQSIAAAWLACVIALCAAGEAATLCAFEAAGARGIVDGGAGDGLRTPAFAVFAALASSAGQPLSILALDARHGAAFTVGGDSPSLWLVDLSGARRALPPLSGSSSRLSGGRRGCRWATVRGPGRRALAAYGIARFAGVGVADRDVAREWALGREA